MEEKIKEMKMPNTEVKTKDKRPITKDKTKEIAKITNQIIDILPKLTEERKRKRNKDVPHAREGCAANHQQFHLLCC